MDEEGKFHLPAGLFGQGGLTWAAQPNNSQGQSVISDNGLPEAYNFTGELGTKVTNFLGVFYEYQIGNTFPGWKGTTGAADVRAVHFFHVLGNELLVGIDSNNAPTVQDVWNSTPDWSFPFYSSPQSPTGPASPMISSLASQVGSIGIYALLDRQVYLELSFYRAATGFLKWMSAGTSFENGSANYLKGYDPYWRAYWTRAHGPHSIMVGTFGMRASVFPNSSEPSGAADVFTDYGTDVQYQHLGHRSLTLRGSYIYEARSWNASFPLGAVGVSTGNLKSLNTSVSYVPDDKWAFHAGYFLTNGNHDSMLYAITTPSGELVSTSPKTTGYTLEVDRHITQNLQLIAQYRGFLDFNGVRHNIDGMGRNASDNNTLWLSVFFAF